jgi:hypothetical protein
MAFAVKGASGLAQAAWAGLEPVVGSRYASPKCTFLVRSQGGS